MNKNEKIEITRGQLALLLNSARRNICKTCLRTLNDLGVEETKGHLDSAIRVMGITKETLSAPMTKRELIALEPLYNDTVRFLDETNQEIIDTINESPTFEEAVRTLYRHFIDSEFKDPN